MQTGNNQSSSVPKIVGAIIAILVCCSCVLIAGAGIFIYRAYRNVPLDVLTPFAPPTENTVTPAPTVELNRPATNSVSTETLDTLGQTLVPENDPYELACRLKATCDVSKTIQGKSYKVGDKENFWILNEE